MNPTRPAALAAGHWCWRQPCTLAPAARPLRPCSGGPGWAGRRGCGRAQRGRPRVERRLSDASLLLWCGVPCCGVPAKSLAGEPCRLVKEPPIKLLDLGALPGPTCQQQRQQHWISQGSLDPAAAKSERFSG
eukprot:gene14813-biopygen600